MAELLLRDLFPGMLRLGSPVLCILLDQEHDVPEITFSPLRPTAFSAANTQLPRPAA